MKNSILRIGLVFIALLSAICGARAQEISGFSTVSFVYTLPPHQNPYNQASIYRPPIKYPAVQSYADTEEDYTASLYYNVQSTSALYYGGSQQPLDSQTFTGNPTANGYYDYRGNELPGVYSEYTAHIVDFFYVTSIGGYYDPYGFSAFNGNPDGDYNSGYWFSVYVYGTYVAEASVVLGEDYNMVNKSDGDYQGESSETILYQAFIPPDWVYGPPSTCPNDIYAGDNRTFDPSLGSFRGMQQISVGIGGYTTLNAPPIQATGWTYQFSENVLQNNAIPSTAYNIDYLGQCNAATVNAYGHASTANMVMPAVTYGGTSSTSTQFNASISNPVPLWSFSIDWNTPVTLTEPNPSDLHVSGTLNADCYPAHEVSVGTHDVQTWMPSSNNIVYIAGCLGGISQVNEPINYDIPLVVP